jgi:hypothetical protein
VSGKKTGPMAFVASLKARAAKGDKMAMAELAKLRALGAQYKAMAIDQAAEHAADEIAAEDEEDGDEIAGDEEQAEQFGSDKLDQADFIAQKFKNADGLTQKVALRNHGWKGLADVAKFVRTNPPSVMQGVIGGYQIVRSDDIAPIQVANWGGEDEETLPITVTIAPVEQIPTGISLSNSRVRPFASVQWGTRAALVKAFIDIGRGAQLTINGSYCTVSVGLDPPPGGAVTSMKLAGMLSFYPCVRTAPVTRTLYIDGILAGAAATFTVPPFAKNLTVLTIPTAGASPFAGPLSILFFDGASQLVYARNFIAGDDTVFGPLLLSDDVVSVQISNGAGSTLTGRAVFELAI